MYIQKVFFIYEKTTALNCLKLMSPIIYTSYSSMVAHANIFYNHDIK